MSESTLVKMPYCWKSHVVAQMVYSEEQNLAFRNSFTLTFRQFSPIPSGISGRKLDFSTHLSTRCAR